MIECEEKAACQREFTGLRDKLDRIDEAIRGNGKPGIHMRLDRLEQDAKRQAKLVWLIVGAIVTTAASGAAQWLMR